MATDGRSIEKDRENKVGHRAICKQNDPMPRTVFGVVELRIGLIIATISIGDRNAKSSRVSSSRALRVSVPRYVAG